MDNVSLYSQFTPIHIHSPCLPASPTPAFQLPQLSRTVHTKEPCTCWGWTKLGKNMRPEPCAPLQLHNSSCQDLNHNYKRNPKYPGLHPSALSPSDWKWHQENQTPLSICDQLETAAHNIQKHLHALLLLKCAQHHHMHMIRKQSHQAPAAQQ